MSDAGRARLVRRRLSGGQVRGGNRAGGSEIFRQGLLDDVFVFFFFQRTSGIDEASAGSDLCEGGAQDCESGAVQLCEIVGFEAPLDFGIAGERAGAGAGDVGENAIEWAGHGEMLGVGGDDLDLRGMWLQQFLQQAGAMGMKFDGGDCGGGIVVGDGERLAAGSGAAVEDVCSGADEGGDELRGFVLDDDFGGCGTLECW